MKRATILITILSLLFVTLSLADYTGSAEAQDVRRDSKPSARIVGGKPVPDGKYPFLVALLDRRIGGTTYDSQFCGGTLVDSNKVLTAAHCVSRIESQDLQITVGRTVLDSNQGQVRNISRISIHPLYKAVQGTYRYDAAVLTLRRPVANLEPINLANVGQDSLESPGGAATIAGWGNTEGQPAIGFGKQEFPQRVRDVEVPLVSDAVADASYSKYVPALMVAAGKLGKDSCQGDSGGPAFVRTALGYTQIGISSFGIGCATSEYPGVYTEINNPRIKSFIDAQLANTTSNTQISRVSQSSNQVVNISQNGN